MKRVNQFLPGSVEAAAYAGLDAIPDILTKRPKLPPRDRTGQKRRLTGVTEDQGRMFGGLFKKAIARVHEEADKREGKFLRRFDDINDSRTYQQRWDALAELIGPLCARLDLAQMVVGWMDKHGKMHVNRQRKLCEDSGVREWTLSRLLSDLERAGYVRRKFRRIFYKGKKWITRVTIHVRRRFFIDLGLGHELAEAQTRKRVERRTVLGVAQARTRQSLEKEAAEAKVRKDSHDAAQRAVRQKQHQQKQLDKVEYKRAWTAAWVAFAQANADLGRLQLSQAFARAHPHFAIHPDALP